MRHDSPHYRRIGHVDVHENGFSVLIDGRAYSYVAASSYIKIYRDTYAECLLGARRLEADDIPVRCIGSTFLSS